MNMYLVQGGQCNYQALYLHSVHSAPTAVEEMPALSAVAAVLAAVAGPARLHMICTKQRHHQQPAADVPRRRWRRRGGAPWS